MPLIHQNYFSRRTLKNRCPENLQTILRKESTACILFIKLAGQKPANWLKKSTVKSQTSWKFSGVFPKNFSMNNWASLQRLFPILFSIIIFDVKLYTKFLLTFFKGALGKLVPISEVVILNHQQTSIKIVVELSKIFGLINASKLLGSHVKVSTRATFKNKLKLHLNCASLYEFKVFTMYSSGDIGVFQRRNNSNFSGN